VSLGIVATLKIKPGREREFESIITELVEKVLANEPGSQLYKLFRSQTEKGTYVVMEICDDAEALKVHQQSDHVRVAIPKLEAVLANSEFHFLDSV
jgi:quinol monooxygenase YgiN